MKELKFKGTDKYLADPHLVEMVNLAMVRQRPLLLTGEAGTGKTQLAYAVSQALGMKLEREQMTSRMKEGEEVCYTFDSLLRLTDSQLTKIANSTNGRDVSNPLDYVRYGAMGRAFISEDRRVVLLDEIDKTETDVHDDLLRVLESYEFEIREANSVVCAKQKPVVIITSNGKRELSDPFLRRVYAHHINFPSVDQLSQIAMSHYPELSREMRRHAVNIVYELRKNGLDKPPATGELLEWLGALSLRGIEPPASIHDGDGIPLVGVLLKRGSDLKKYQQDNVAGRRTRDQRGL